MGKARKMRSVRPGGLAPAAVRPVRPVSEAKVLRLIESLRKQARQIEDVPTAARLAGRLGASSFDAGGWCVAELVPGRTPAGIVGCDGDESAWDLELLARFARGERVERPRDVAMARLHRRDRAWAALGLRWPYAQVGWDVRDRLRTFAWCLDTLFAEIERSRVAEVRTRIERKIQRRLKSTDLFYQILDGLRSLTGYDHSGLIAICSDDGSSLRIAAEKVAWRRGKSRRVGLTSAADPAELRGVLAGGAIGLRASDAGAWACWSRAASSGCVASLLSAGPADGPGVRDVLVGPCVTGDGLHALVVVGAQHAGTFGDYERGLLASFLPHVAIALQNSMWAEAMEARVMQAEQKHLMADLARGVAHDINNSLGAVAPLVEQLRHEASTGVLDAATLPDDLSQIDKSVRTCRRIFEGMLRFAREDRRTGESTSVLEAVRLTMAMVEDSLRRSSVVVEVRVPESLPNAAIEQSALVRVLFNLASNARDAMSDGGRLEVCARASGDAIVVEVRDDGPGLPESLGARAVEPFETTKPHGTGLGLSICRSVVWRCGGDFLLESEAGAGVTVRFTLPIEGASA